jgi:ABC-type transport system substrate-binding protein
MKGKNGKRIVIFVLTALLTLGMVGLAACGGKDAPPSNTSDGKPVYGGTATVYYPKFYNYFDPAMWNEYQFSFWLETLWVIDWGLNDPDTYQFGPTTTPMQYMTGQLADTWEFDSATGKLTVKLREDVKFQEGEPYNGRAFTADDVIWSYSRLLGLNGMEKVELEMDWPGMSLTMLKNVTKIDEYTVEFEFNDGFNNEIGLTDFMNVKVNIGGPEWDNCPQTWEYAKGTGPYVLEEYAPDNYMNLVKNESYYGYDERYPENKLPYIDTIKLVYIADSSNILSQAMTGDLDWFGENGKDILNPAELSQLSSADKGVLTGYYSSPSGIGFKVNQKPFTDVKVRTALQKAIDLETINKEYFQSDGDLLIPGLFSPNITAWSTAGSWDADLMESFSYDPDVAKQLLTEAGYPDGFEFTIQLDPLADLDLFNLAADYLAKVGVTMKIETAAEMMEAVQVSQNGDDPRMFNTNAGGFTSYSLANMMTGDGPMPNGFKHSDQGYLTKLAAMGASKTLDEQSEIALELDGYFPAQHWAVYLSGMKTNYDFMSARIGGYTGEKVYFDDNMRTVWARLWVNQ